MKPNETIHTKRHTSANDTHIAWNQFWILPRGIVCPCPLVRAPFPAKDMNCIPPARAPPHILAPSHPEPACLRRNTGGGLPLLPHARTRTHIHNGNESMSDLCQQRHVVIRSFGHSALATGHHRHIPHIKLAVTPDETR